MRETRACDAGRESRTYGARACGLAHGYSPRACLLVRLLYSLFIVCNGRLMPRCIELEMIAGTTSNRWGDVFASHIYFEEYAFDPITSESGLRIGMLNA
jgi:hypothetical protein